MHVCKCRTPAPGAQAQRRPTPRFWTNPCTSERCMNDVQQIIAVHDTSSAWLPSCSASCMQVHGRHARRHSTGHIQLLQRCVPASSAAQSPVIRTPLECGCPAAPAAAPAPWLSAERQDQDQCTPSRAASRQVGNLLGTCARALLSAMHASWPCMRMRQPSRLTPDLATCPVLGALRTHALSAP